VRTCLSRHLTKIKQFERSASIIDKNGFRWLTWSSSFMMVVFPTPPKPTIHTNSALILYCCWNNVVFFKIFYLFIQTSWIFSHTEGSSFSIIHDALNNHADEFRIVSITRLEVKAGWDVKEASFTIFKVMGYLLFFLWSCNAWAYCPSIMYARAQKT